MMLNPWAAESSRGPLKRQVSPDAREYPDPVDEAGGGEHLAPLGRVGAELDEGLERQAEEAGADAEQHDDGQAGRQVGGRGVQEQRGNGQAGRADGDDAEFHVPAGELGRQQRTDADTEGGRQEEVAALRLGQPELAPCRS